MKIEDVVSRLVLSGLLYASCTTLALSNESLHAITTILILYISSTTGGYIMHKIRLPPILGMIISGVLVRNICDSDSLPDIVYGLIRNISLAIIMTRSGLSLDTESLKNDRITVFLLTALPCIVEAITCSVLAILLFDMTFFFGLTLGFILAAVSPAIIIPGMMNLQKTGYGVSKGIPTLMTAAASFDDVLSISGFSIFSVLAIKKGDSSILHSLIHGPLTIVIGVIAGIIGGMLVSLTKMWNTLWKQRAILLTSSIMFMCVGNKYNQTGAGALACLIMAAMAVIRWKLDKRREPQTDAYEDKKPLVDVSVILDQDFTFAWDLLCEPLLFSSIGHTFDTSSLNFNTIPKEIILIVLALGARVFTAYFSTNYSKQNLSSRERCFVALAWTPKATVQAALCSIPLETIQKSLKALDEFERFNQIGKQILSIGVISILVAAPTGLLAIEYLGPKLLMKTPACTSV